MEQSKKATYFKKLSAIELSTNTINSILEYLRNQGLRDFPIDPDIYKKSKYGEKIAEEHTRLHVCTIEGNTSWEGLLVGQL